MKSATSEPAGRTKGIVIPVRPSVRRSPYPVSAKETRSCEEDVGGGGGTRKKRNEKGRDGETRIEKGGTGQRESF